MKVLAALVGSSLIVATASAGPTVRFGVTDAITDQSAPGKNEIGPMVGLGLREGRFVGEIEYAYLSFFDPDTTGHGVQRVGLSLRADLVRRYATFCQYKYGCTRMSALWGEIGFGERFGQWLLDSSHIAPATPHQPEAHIAFGFELDNQIEPMRNGWQMGVRFAVIPRGNDPESSCRSSSGAECSTAMVTNTGGLATSVLVEWTFLFGQ